MCVYHITLKRSFLFLGNFFFLVYLIVGLKRQLAHLQLLESEHGGGVDSFGGGLMAVSVASGFVIDCTR